MALNNFKHGTLAGCLIPLSLLVAATAFYIERNKIIAPEKETIFLALCVAGPVFWLWGFFHLVRHYKLSVFWTLLAVLFIPGLALLFWAAAQQPRWEQQRIRRFAANQQAEFAEPSAAQKAKSGKKAKVPPPR